jgi:hypothetical protein
MTRCYSRSDPKIGHKGVEAIECVLRNNMECALMCILKEQC